MRRFPAMKSLYHILLISLLALLAGACISPRDRETTLKLNRLERQLDTLPGRESGRPFIDSLESIPAEALSSPRLRALHSLLLTQARRKERLPLNEDSLLSDAYRYYANSGDSRRLMKASLYSSVANRDEGNYKEAFFHAIRAYHIAENLGEPLWIARTAEQRAFLARDRYYRDEEHDFWLKAARCYEESGFTISAQHCYMELGDYFRAVHQYERSEQLLDSVIDNAADSIVLFGALTYAVDNLLEQQKFGKGVKYLDRMEEIYDIDSWPSGMLLTKAQIEMHRGNDPIPYLEKAKNGLDFVGMKAIYFSSLLEYYKQKKDLPRVYAFTDSLLWIENDFLGNSFKETTSLQTKDFYENLSERTETDFSRTTAIVGALLLLLNIAVFVFLIIFYLRQVRHNSPFNSGRRILHNRISAENVRLLERITEYSARNRQLTAENLSLTDSQARLTDRQMEMANRQAELFQQKWDTLNNLCKEYSKSDNDDINRRNVYDRLEKQLRMLKKQNEIDNLVRQADEYLNGIVTLFEKECPGLPSELYQIFGLMAVGFGSKIICFLTDTTTANFYSRKKRLIEKINAIQPPHREFFLKCAQSA